MKNLLKIYSILCLTLAVCLSSSVVSLGQTNTKNDAQDRNEAKFSDADDAKLLVDAYSSGMVEIKMAESIKTRTVMDNVKKMAGTMITAHTDMNNQIRAIAAKKKISLPTELTKSQQDDIEKFNKTSATDVNEEYAEMLVASHKKSVSHFEKGSSKAEDADIRALFTKGLPVVREHLAMAEELHNSIELQEQEQRKADPNMN